MQVLQHLRILLPAARVLVFQDVRGRAREAGEEQHQIVFQIVQGFRRHLQRRHLHVVVGQKAKTGDAAERRDVLVLLADGLVQQVQLDVAGLLRQLLAGDVVLLHGVQGPQQRGGETARGSESGARRDVRHTGDFEVRNPYLHQAKRFAHDRMPDLPDRLHRFHFGVLDDDFLGEGLVQRNIDILIDGGGNDETGMLAIVGGQVGSPSTE